jgi:pyridoxine 5-phosphate synthase
LPRLSVNVDHIATPAGAGTEPDPVAAARSRTGRRRGSCSPARSRRHIHDRDLRLMRQTVQTKLTSDTATDEMVRIAMR